MDRHTYRAKRDLEHFAARLRAARGERQMSQAKLAAATGIDRTTIVRIEQAERAPQFYQIVAIHKALGVPRGSLLAA